MAIIRSVRIYENGQLVREEPYEVTDAQLAEEAEEKNVSDKIVAALGVPWTAAQTEQAVKLIARRLLAKGLLP